MNILQKRILIKLKELERNFPKINYNYKVNFKLKSKSSMGEYSRENNIFYFNMDIVEKAGTEYNEIIIHEFAHMITTILYGFNIQVHGKEWKNIMRTLGATNISATIDFNKYLDNRIKVSCNCNEFYITKNRLTRMNNGRKYKCQNCSAKIKLV